MNIIVEYEIPDDGDCSECEGFSTDSLGDMLCCIFKIWNPIHEQCQQCKDYLKQQEENK